MKIGLDFDNTIARYDRVFVEAARGDGLIPDEYEYCGKTALKGDLLAMPNGERLWMRLQGQVYGRYMCKAEAMSGFLEFLLRCRLRGVEVFIVSHKTEFGHFDEACISLRDAATQWMESKGFFDKASLGLEKDNVFYCATREEKVARIAGLDLDCFVDDLPEVFAEKGFPASVEKILFDEHGSHDGSCAQLSFNSWQSIAEHLLGQTDEEENCRVIKCMTGFPIDAIEPVSGRGNSRIFKLSAQQGNDCALKLYPLQGGSKGSRLKNEFDALLFLRQNGILNVPEPLGRNDDYGYGLYSWIDGDGLGTPAHDDFSQAIRFIRSLYRVSRDFGVKYAGLATEACLSGSELISQIERRLQRLRDVRSGSRALSEFLHDEFLPVWDSGKGQCLTAWPERSRYQELNSELRILSPSDFGFHNAIKSKGQLYFLDFEYFGWDDPVKLTADFLWHPAFELSQDLSGMWREAMTRLFETNDDDFSARLDAAMPLYGMRWIMILLNEFLPGVARKRLVATGADMREEELLRSRQLEKAREYLSLVKALKYSAPTV